MSSWARRLDEENLSYEGPNRDSIPWNNIPARIERSSLETAVRTAKILEHVAKFDPSQAGFAQAESGLIRDLESGLNGAREEMQADGSTKYFDVESGQDLSALAKARDELPKLMSKLKERAAKSMASREAFWDYKVGQSQSEVQIGNQLKRHVMGSDAHAVAIRALMQTVITVSAGIQFQIATATALRSFFTKNPDQIPEGVLTNAREALMDAKKNVTESAVQAEAIDTLSKLSSTYFDEATTPGTVVAFGDPLVAGSRSGIAAVTDSKNERSKRIGNIGKAIQKAENPSTQKTRAERFMEATKRVHSANLKSNMISGGIAATVGLLGAGNKPGYLNAIEAAKTLSFAAMAGESNTLADGLREAAYTGDSELFSQFLKVVARTGGREVAQVMKTGLGYLQSALLDGNLNERSTLGDFGISTSITALASGGMKEAVGGAFQYAGNELLPPDEASLLTIVKTIESIGEVNEALASISGPDLLSRDGNQSLQDLSYPMQKFLGDVSKTSALEFADADFDNPHGEYLDELDERIATRRRAQSVSS